jgi:hypothetical protein
VSGWFKSGTVSQSERIMHATVKHPSNMILGWYLVDTSSSLVLVGRVHAHMYVYVYLYV